MRRIHVRKLIMGEIRLDEMQARHARDVLRLPDGAAVSIFDDSGQTADGQLLWAGRTATVVHVDGPIAPAARGGMRWSVAAAVPKGERADWMVEKLSELGADAFIPLATARSVVLPQGVGKTQRWERLAVESAKQSRRPGLMRIHPLTPLDAAMKNSGGRGWFLSAADPAMDIVPALASLDVASQDQRLTLYVGPEGGWTSAEVDALIGAGLTGVRLTPTILRVETAAVAAAAIVATWVATWR